MSQAMKPCPFCGGTEISDSSFDIEVFYFTCAQCGTDGPVGSNIDEAIEKWNSRREQSHIMTDERHAFEAHCEEQGYDIARHITNDEYKNVILQHKWESWLARAFLGKEGL